MSIDTRNQTFNILLVEDNPADIRLVKEAFKESDLHVKLHVIEEGTNTIKFIHKQETYENVPSPDLILLDLNMPKTDGHVVIANLKNDETIKIIPIIVFSSSSSEKDIYESYRLGANCYLTKPTDFDGYIKLMKLIEDFWLRTAQIPHRL